LKGVSDLRDFLNTLQKLDALLPPQEFLTALLRTVTDSLNIKGGLVLRQENHNYLPVVHNLDTQVNSKLVESLPELLQKFDQGDTYLLSGKGVPPAIKEIDALIWTPILSSGTQIGACLWICEQS